VWPDRQLVVTASEGPATPIDGPSHDKIDDGAGWNSRGRKSCAPTLTTRPLAAVIMAAEGGQCMAFGIEFPPFGLTWFYSGDKEKYRCNRASIRRGARRTKCDKTEASVLVGCPHNLTNEIMNEFSHPSTTITGPAGLPSEHSYRRRLVCARRWVCPCTRHGMKRCETARSTHATKYVLKSCWVHGPSDGPALQWCLGHALGPANKHPLTRVDLP
jgi:hypothetical protein